MITTNKIKSELLKNNYYYIQFKYKSYDGYKSNVVNNIVNALTLIFDITYFVVGKTTCFTFYELPQILYYSPIILHYGFHSVLSSIDNWLVPDVDVAPVE